MYVLFTGIGLSAAAGLNAFIPLAVLAMLSRFTSVVDLSPGFSWLSTWPAILVALALLTIELVIDKIPGVDTANDFFQTPLRPTAAAVVFAAISSAHVGSSGGWWHLPIWVAYALGAAVGLTVHLSKAASRTAIGAATGGAGTPLASFAEEGLALTLCLFALVLPWLVVPVIAGMVVAVYRIVTIGRRRRQRIADRQRRWRAEREAAEIAAGLRGWLARPTLNLRPRAAKTTKVRRAGRTS